MANIVAVDGMAVGNWMRREKARRVELIVVPWTEWSAPTWEALGDAAERLSSHLGVPVSLQAGEVP